MASQAFNSPQNRRRRKLPNIQQADNCLPDNTAVYWCSYQSALHWIRQHEQIISQCVQLLQVYPNLIQDVSMDQFWDFIEPLVTSDTSQSMNRPTTGPQSRVTSGVTRSRSKVSLSKASEIPHISITESKDTPEPTFTIPVKYARTPRVHLISHSHSQISQEDRYLHMGILDMLQEDFYVRVVNTKQWSSSDHSNDHMSSNQTSHRHFIIAESDVCVYLFSDATLNDKGCFHDLCVALTYKIPIVYVRCHNKELPKTFSDTIKKTSNGCVTLRDYAERYIIDTNPTPREPSSAKNSCSKTKLAPLKIKNRPSSASDVNKNGAEGRRGKRKHAPVHTELDLLFTLVSSFKNSCVFDENDVARCAANLKHSIHQILGIYETQPELPSFSHTSIDSAASDDHLSRSDSSDGSLSCVNIFSRNKSSLSSTPGKTMERKLSLLSVPDPDDIISTREWGLSGSISAPPHGQPQRDFNGGSTFFFGSDIRMVSPPPVELKNTTYLVFDRNKSPDGPRRVDFPLRKSDNVMMESDLESDDNEPITSPIDFHEIDLSREINARGTPESDISSVSSS